MVKSNTTHPLIYKKKWVPQTCFSFTTILFLNSKGRETKSKSERGDGISKTSKKREGDEKTH